jgi:cytochrome c oxidase subunit 2
VRGPASLAPAEAQQAIDDFISQSDPAIQLGKDFDDPDGTDDDVDDATGRTLYLPLNRQVRILVMSRDVIHDFFLPDFRTQLYAVPGLTGTLALTATHAGPAGELICGQLCGTGHAQMHTDVVVLPEEEYARRFGIRPFEVAH